VPKVFSANSSGILIDNEPIEGVRGIDYQQMRETSEIFALGTEERVAVYHGAKRVRGRIRVASASKKLDDFATSGGPFQIVCNLRHGETQRSVAFDECHISAKDFTMAAGGHGETIYEFSATRVREEDAA
jgi:hypothetical protein